MRKHEVLPRLTWRRREGQDPGTLLSRLTSGRHVVGVRTGMGVRNVCDGVREGDAAGAVWLLATASPHARALVAGLMENLASRMRSNPPVLVLHTKLPNEEVLKALKDEEDIDGSECVLIGGGRGWERVPLIEMIKMDDGSQVPSLTDITLNDILLRMRKAVDGFRVLFRDDVMARCGRQGVATLAASREELATLGPDDGLLQAMHAMHEHALTLPSSLSDVLPSSVRAVVLLPTVSGLLPDGALPPFRGVWDYTRLADTIMAAILSRPDEDILVLPHDALDMPHLPHVCGWCRGKTYVYGDVAQLLRDVDDEVEGGSDESHSPMATAMTQKAGQTISAEEDVRAIDQAIATIELGARSKNRRKPKRQRPKRARKRGRKRGQNGTVVDRWVARVEQERRLAETFASQTEVPSGGMPFGIEKYDEVVLTSATQVTPVTAKSKSGQYEYDLAVTDSYRRAYLSSLLCNPKMSHRTTLRTLKLCLGFGVSRGLVRDPYRYYQFWKARPEARGAYAGALQVMALLQCCPHDTRLVYALWNRVAQITNKHVVTLSADVQTPDGRVSDAVHWGGVRHRPADVDATATATASDSAETNIDTATATATATASDSAETNIDTATATAMAPALTETNIDTATATAPASSTTETNIDTATATASAPTLESARMKTVTAHALRRETGTSHDNRADVATFLPPLHVRYDFAIGGRVGSCGTAEACALPLLRPQNRFVAGVFTHIYNALLPVSDPHTSLFFATTRYEHETGFVDYEQREWIAHYCASTGCFPTHHDLRMLLMPPPLQVSRDAYKSLQLKQSWITKCAHHTDEPGMKFVCDNMLHIRDAPWRDIEQWEKRRVEYARTHPSPPQTVPAQPKEPQETDTTKEDAAE